MPNQLRKILNWLPRALSLVLVFFVFFLPLGFYNNNAGFLDNARHMGLYFLPAVIMVVLAVLAWNWPGLGAAVFFSAGGAVLLWLYARSREWNLFLSAPLFFTAFLFFVSYCLKKQFDLKQINSFLRRKRP